MSLLGEILKPILRSRRDGEFKIFINHPLCILFSTKMYLQYSCTEKTVMKINDDKYHS